MAPKPDASPNPSKGGGSLNKVIFVSYGTFDCNSAGHIAGFARRLHQLGYATAVCARERPLDAYAFGAPEFAFFTNQDLALDPQGVIGFDGSFEPARTVMIGWTPRKAVRRALSRAAAVTGAPYVIHFEDNEDHLTRLRLEKAGPAAEIDPFAAAADDAAEREALLRGALGATIIEERLREILPARTPTLLLEPGVDSSVFGTPLPTYRRASLLRAAGVSGSARVVVYPGNAHRANVGEMAELYRAVRQLRESGRDVVLLKTGVDDPEAAATLDDVAAAAGVIALGQTPRPLLVDLLKCADLFVQPGAPGPFNDYRLPSKLPEFMAVGRPIVLPRTNVGLRLRHGVDAMLLETGAAEEIAAHAGAILADPVLAERLAANVRRFATRTYDWDRQGDKLADYLERLHRSRP